MNPSTALARTFVDELARHGLTDLCLSPGSRSAPLALAAHEHPGIRLHVVIDERSAGFLAVGLARGSGRPAAVVTTSGTAAANLHPAIAEAFEARVPLIALTADRPPELRQVGANQVIDQVKLYGDAVRAFLEVGAAEAREGVVGYWRSAASWLWGLALGSPPGPVHANLAFREPLTPEPSFEGGGFDLPLDGREDRAPWTAQDRGARMLASPQIDRLAAELSGAERGLLVLGESGAPAEPLLRLADALAWPVLAEPLSGARTGPRAISTYGALLATPSFREAHRPDLVVRVGRAGLARPLLDLLSSDVPQVVVDAHGTLPDPGRAASRLVTADPGPLADALAARVAPSGPSGWAEAWAEAERRARAAIDAVLDAQESPTEPRTARDLAAALPPGATLVAASSMPIRDLDAFQAPREGLRVVGNRGASGIDGFASTALGVALSRAGPVAALAGDLSVLHDQNGFLLDAREGVDLPIVVVNNDGGGIFSFLPQAGFPEAFERLFGTPHGIDFARLAAVHGLRHTLVEQAASLPGALEGDGVRLVEVRTDRAENVALHSRLRAAAAAALEG